MHSFTAVLASAAVLLSSAMAMPYYGLKPVEAPSSFKSFNTAYSTGIEPPRSFSTAYYPTAFPTAFSTGYSAPSSAPPFPIKNHTASDPHGGYHPTATGFFPTASSVYHFSPSSIPTETPFPIGFSSSSFEPEKSHVPEPPAHELGYGHGY